MKRPFLRLLLVSIRACEEAYRCREESERHQYRSMTQSDERFTKGPARIVSLSADISGHNVTLGQDKNAFDVRLRTTKTISTECLLRPILRSPRLPDCHPEMQGGTCDFNIDGDNGAPNLASYRRAVVTVMP